MIRLFNAEVANARNHISVVAFSLYEVIRFLRSRNKQHGPIYPF